MGVFPAASGKFLPPTWRELMSHPVSGHSSFFIDFYITIFYRLIFKLRYFIGRLTVKLIC